MITIFLIEVYQAAVFLATARVGKSHSPTLRSGFSAHYNSLTPTIQDQSAYDKI